MCKKGNSFLFLLLNYHLNYILSNILHKVFNIILRWMLFNELLIFWLWATLLNQDVIYFVKMIFNLTIITHLIWIKKIINLFKLFLYYLINIYLIDFAPRCWMAFRSVSDLFHPKVVDKFTYKIWWLIIKYIILKIKYY